MNKKHAFLPLLLAAFFAIASCSKDKNNTTPATTYAATQGKITGAGGASFTTTGSKSFFERNIDTFAFRANVDTTADGFSTGFYMEGLCHSTGTFNFDDFADAAAGTTFDSGAIAYYQYETANSSGTIIAHLFFVKSGTFTINSVSSTTISGTYNAYLVDENSNGDAPRTITGTFDGHF